MSLAETYLKFNDTMKRAFLDGMVESCDNLETLKWVNQEFKKLEEPPVGEEP